MEKIELDRYSLQLLDELQRDARQTMQQLADKVWLSATPCWKRIKDMEAAGVLRGYTAVLDRARLGLGLLVVVEVNLDRHNDESVDRFEAAVMACPPIVRCLSTTGEADYLLTVLAADIAAYDTLLQRVLFKLPGVAHLRSRIVLREVKTDTRLPLDDGLPVAPCAAGPGRPLSRES